MTRLNCIARFRERWAPIVGIVFASMLAVTGQTHAEGSEGGSLVVLMPAEPPHLNSAFLTSAVVGAVSGKVFEGLVAYDENMNWVPSLAESWEVSASGTEITFILRADVAWHDGTPFTSADVKFSAEEIWKKLHPRGQLTLSDLIAVDTPDELTAVFRFASPNPAVFKALHAHEAPVLPLHIYDGSDASANPANSAPVGTGPFIFDQWVKGSHLMLTRNEDYWADGRPYLDQVIFRFIPDAGSRAAAIEAGEAHVAIANAIPLSDAQRLSELETVSVSAEGQDLITASVVMEINNSRELLSDTRVRQAIAYAIDQEFISDVVFHGYGRPSTGLIPSYQTAFYTSDVRTYSVDQEMAEQLLDEAGYPRGDDGVRFSLTLEALPYGDDFTRTAQVVKQQLSQIGIEVEIRSSDIGGYIRQVYTEHDFDLTINAFSALPDPVLGVTRFYDSRNIRKGVPFSNATQYANPEMDRIIDTIKSETDPTLRQEAIHGLQRMAAEDVPFLAIVEWPLLTVYASSVVGLLDSPEAMYSSYANVYMD